MDRVELGRTGLSVSVVGLGGGGDSRLGQRHGAPVEDSVRIIHEALDLGVNYIDTARSYGTEEIVGIALEGRRDSVVLSTKINPIRADGSRLDRQAYRRAIEDSFRLLRTDTVDVFHLHGVRTRDYEYCVSELLPEIERMRDLGSIRSVAISERFGEEFDHTMFQRAFQDDCWDVMMVGFNILNPSARQSVFPQTIAANIGVEVMYAVRHIFSHSDALRTAVGKAVAAGVLDPEGIDLDDPLGFLIRESGASSITEAAYRFARHEPGCHVILTGTSQLEHLKENVRSINLAPLPDADRACLARLFGHLAHFSGD